MIKKQIFSIIILYNLKEDEFRSSIQRLEEQTEFIVVCNNSNYDVDYKEKENMKIFNFRENLGIAKAQSIGMKWAFENGADFVLQMDQDSEPDEKLVENLLKCYYELTEKGYKIGLVGPQDYDKDTSEINKARIKKGKYIDNTNYVSMEQTLSSGSLIPKNTYELVGGMEDGLFIDAVDEEYCWRIRKNGLLVVKNNNALLAHKIGEGVRSVLGMNLVVSAPIRYYYQFRNVILLSTRNYSPLYWRISMIIKVILKLFIFPLTIEDGRERLKFMLLGIKDGIARKYGRIDKAAKKEKLKELEKDYNFYIKRIK